MDPFLSLVFHGFVSFWYGSSWLRSFLVDAVCPGLEPPIIHSPVRHPPFTWWSGMHPTFHMPHHFSSTAASLCPLLVPLSSGSSLAYPTPLQLLLHPVVVGGGGLLTVSFKFPKELSFFSTLPDQFSWSPFAWKFRVPFFVFIHFKHSYFKLGICNPLDLNLLSCFLCV